MALLELENITYITQDQIILDSISLSLHRQEILGIIGPNGAGKTSLFDVISGFIRANSGTIRFQGLDVTGYPPHRLCRMGIGRTFQIPRPLKELTVFQNVLLACLMNKTGHHGENVVERVDNLLEQLDLTTKRDTFAGKLTLSEQRKLEIARALGCNPKLLLLDEVAAGMSPFMAEKIVNLVKELNKGGLTIIMIDHFISMTTRLANKIIALDSGKKIAEGVPQEVLNNAQVKEAYLGY